MRAFVASFGVFVCPSCMFQCWEERVFGTERRVRMRLFSVRCCSVERKGAFWKERLENFRASDDRKGEEEASFPIQPCFYHNARDLRRRLGKPENRRIQTDAYKPSPPDSLVQSRSAMNLSAGKHQRKTKHCF